MVVIRRRCITKKRGRQQEAGGHIHIYGGIGLEYAIEMRGITKRFGEVAANRRIDFLVKPQEIHCLLGENGSGKTTLMNVLFGIHAMDEGRIIINGKSANIRSPRDASQLGIGMVHQHFMLFNQNTVLENIILGDERVPLFLDYEKSREDVQALLDRYEFHLNLDDKICDLSVGMKQRVEILKVLYRGAQIIIFDEPTSVLTPQESDILLGMIQNLREQGKTVIFISHKLGETMAIGDSMTVLRKGEAVAHVKRENTSAQDLARHMVGKEIDTRIERKEMFLGECVFEMKDISIWEHRGSCNFQVHENEIFGIAGVDGNGQMELEEGIMGLREHRHGHQYLYGEEITHDSTLRRKLRGMAHIPSDRHKYGILGGQSLSRNYLLGNQDRIQFKSYGLIRSQNIDRFAGDMIETYNVHTAGIEQTAGSLSGGNQQKLVLSRELSQSPKFILAAQPTVGLDIGAIEFVHKTLLQKREEGCAILLISADLSEVMSLSDRIAVMYEGEIIAIGKSSEFTREELGLMMAGHYGGLGQ